MTRKQLEKLVAMTSFLFVGCEDEKGVYGPTEVTSCLFPVEIRENYAPYFSSKHFIPIAVHYIKQDDGSGQTLDIAAQIEMANTYFNGMNVEFFLADEEEIWESAYYYGDNWHILADEYNLEDMINVYSVRELESNVSGFTLHGTINLGDGGSIAIVSWTNYLSVLGQEIGHYFSLKHTHRGDGSELVNGSNCETDGDYVCDTPADPGSDNNPYIENGCIIDLQTCEILSCGMDANGDTYHPDITNLMSYYLDCMNSVSPEQQKIMVCSIEELQAHLTIEVEDTF